MYVCQLGNTFEHGPNNVKYIHIAFADVFGILQAIFAIKYYMH